MFGFFKKKADAEDLEHLKTAVQTGFSNVKQDFSKTSRWIKHLDEQTVKQEDSLDSLYEEITSIKDDIENIKNILDLLGNKQLFKQQQTVFNKQTAVEGVLNSVQTAVQDPFMDKFLDNLSVTERAIVWVLLNADLKLSYDDLAAMLGKERATIRGQVNSIRQKSEGLIAEKIGKNNKKRFFIPEDVKGTMLKKVKVRLKKEDKESEEEISRSDLV